MGPAAELDDDTGIAELDAVAVDSAELDDEAVDAAAEFDIDLDLASNGFSLTVPGIEQRSADLEFLYANPDSALAYGRDIGPNRDFIGGSILDPAPEQKFLGLDY